MRVRMLADTRPQAQPLASTARGAASSGVDHHQPIAQRGIGRRSQPPACRSLADTGATSGAGETGGGLSLEGDAGLGELRAQYDNTSHGRIAWNSPMSETARSPCA